MTLGTSRQSYIERAPTRYLLLAPSAIVLVSLSCFGVLLPDVVKSLEAPCGSQLPFFDKVLCFFSAFFSDCLSSQFGVAFIASFLSFIAAVLTVSNVESCRLFNQPSRVITTPIVTWLLLNAVTGAVVLPAVLLATVRRRKDATAERQEASSSGYTRPVTPSAPKSPSQSPSKSQDTSKERYLTSFGETYAIPVGITVGYIAPSIAVLISPSWAIVGIWNLFPVYISLFRRFTLYVIRLIRSPSDSEPHHPEANNGSLFRLYTIPTSLSIACHIYYVYFCFTGTSIGSAYTPALKLMIANFWAIAITMVYWLIIESSWRVAVVATVCSAVAGPGTGLCLGWVLKEKCSTQLVTETAAQESEPLLQDSGGHLSTATTSN